LSRERLYDQLRRLFRSFQRLCEQVSQQYPNAWRRVRLIVVHTDARPKRCGRLGGLWADLLATAGQSRWPPLGKINWPLTGSVVTKTTTGQKDDLMSIQGRRSHDDQDCRRKYDEGDGR
jgi:hypothetical protein